MIRSGWRWRQNSSSALRHLQAISNAYAVPVKRWIIKGHPDSVDVKLHSDSYPAEKTNRYSTTSTCWYFSCLRYWELKGNHPLFWNKNSITVCASLMLDYRRFHSSKLSWLSVLLVSAVRFTQAPAGIFLAWDTENWKEITRFFEIRTQSRCVHHSCLIIAGFIHQNYRGCPFYLFLLDYRRFHSSKLSWLSVLPACLAMREAPT